MDSKYVLQKIMDKHGITHPGERRANLRTMLQMQREDIQRQYESGRISREVGLDATRHLMELDLEEAINDPELYDTFLRKSPKDRFGRESGTCLADRLREGIAGWDENITQEAAAEKRRQAFAVTLANRADDHLAAGQLSAADYTWVMDDGLGLDPASAQTARQHTGTNETSPQDLDQHVRPLRDDEHPAVAAATWNRRNGYLADPEPEQSADNAPTQESASDFNMDKWVANREREIAGNSAGD